MTPEEQSRELIDAKLMASEWIVQNCKQMNFGAGPGLAVAEFPGVHGEADYLRYVDWRTGCQTVGYTLKGVEGQSAAKVENRL